MLPRVPKYHGPRVLSGLVWNGYEIAVLENELVRCVVNVGRGTHLPELTYKPKDLDVLFKHPRPHKHHASFMPSAYDDRPYYEHHAGGWFECFPNGGPPSEVHGAKLGFHGEVWGQPFQIDAIEESAEACSLTVTGYTQRTPYRLTKTFRLEKNVPALFLDEKVTNLGEEDLQALWGQHPTLGGPFVNGDCYLECGATAYFDGGENPPVRRKWPAVKDGVDLAKVGAKEDRKTKFVYLTDFPEGRARIVSPAWKLAFQVEWDAAQFPYLWFFENDGALGAPWYGRAQMLAIEPFSGMGNAFEEGHGLMTIPAGATVEASFAGRFVER